MTRVTVVHMEHRRAGDEAFHVHAEGCADLRKRTYAGMYRETHNVNSIRSVVDSQYGPDCGGYYQESGASWENPDSMYYYVADFRIFPCVPTLEKGF